MKLTVSTLKSPHKVSITPNAPWLKLVSRDLCPSAPVNAEVHGELILQVDSAGFILVSGHLSANALQPCDRCGEDVQIPINTEVRATFRPPYETNIPREISLSAEDLEVYFIDGGQVDLETLVNDSLQCAIPSHILCENLAGKLCSATREGLTPGDCDDFAPESPFAVLKNLKKS